MDFNEEYKKIARRALEFSEKARKEGLLALEDDIDVMKANQRDIFELGMRFVVDGTDTIFIDKILTNLVNQEKDETLALLKTIQKEAVLAIQEGTNARILLFLLNSHTNLSLYEDELFREYLEE